MSMLVWLTLAFYDFSKFQILTVITVKKVELRQRAKFRQNRSNRGRDMAIFRRWRMLDKEQLPLLTQRSSRQTWLTMSVW